MTKKKDPEDEIDIDCYKKFKYQKYEWDNVAQVIPRMSFYLEKNMER